MLRKRQLPAPVRVPLVQRVGVAQLVPERAHAFGPRRHVEEPGAPGTAAEHRVRLDEAQVHPLGPHGSGQVGFELEREKRVVGAWIHAVVRVLDDQLVARGHPRHQRLLESGLHRRPDVADLGQHHRVHAEGGGQEGRARRFGDDVRERRALHHAEIGLRQAVVEFLVSDVLEEPNRHVVARGIADDQNPAAFRVRRLRRRGRRRLGEGLARRKRGERHRYAARQGRRPASLGQFGAARQERRVAGALRLVDPELAHVELVGARLALQHPELHETGFRPG